MHWVQLLLFIFIAFFMPLVSDYWSSDSSLHRLFIWISCLRVFFLSQTRLEKVISSHSASFVFKSVILIAFAAYAEAWSYGVAIETSPVKFTLGLLCLPTFGFAQVLIVTSNSEGSEITESKRQSLEETWNMNPEKHNNFILQD